jgi:hypothetical protein
VRQQRGHEARAGADLQHLLVALHLQLLQQAGLDPRVRAWPGRPAQRHLGVDEGQRALRGRHEVLALDHRQQRQHAGSSTSQGRICCSIMLNRACSVHGFPREGQNRAKPEF